MAPQTSFRRTIPQPAELRPTARAAGLQPQAVPGAGVRQQLGRGRTCPDQGSWLYLPEAAASRLTGSLPVGSPSSVPGLCLNRGGGGQPAPCSPAGVWEDRGRHHTSRSSQFWALDGAATTGASLLCKIKLIKGVSLTVGVYKNSTRDTCFLYQKLEIHNKKLTGKSLNI